MEYPIEYKMNVDARRALWQVVSSNLVVASVLEAQRTGKHPADTMVSVGLMWTALEGKFEEFSKPLEDSGEKST